MLLPRKSSPKMAYPALRGAGYNLSITNSDDRLYRAVRSSGNLYRRSPMSDYKICIHCRQSFPATLEFFPTYTVRGVRYLRNLCRPCWRANRREYNAKHPELKQASRKRRDPAIVAAEKKRSHERNREKDNARGKRWREEHLEHAREKARGNYYKKRDTRIAKAMVNTVKRMARKRSLPDTFTAEQWKFALEYFQHTCAVCGRAVGLWHTLAMDHWIPLSDPNCPGTVATNIIPLCHGMDGCNNSKNNRDPLVWLTDKFGSHRARAIATRIEEYFLVWYNTFPKGSSIN